MSGISIGQLCSLFGEVEEDGERWTKWTASNGIARFRICRHASGEVHILLLASRDLLLMKCSDSLKFFRLMIALGIVKDEECMMTFDCNSGDHADCCPEKPIQDYFSMGEMEYNDHPERDYYEEPPL